MRTLGTSPFGNIPPVVKNLLIINILLFIAKELLPGLNMDLWLAVFYPDSQYFRIWQPVSYMFMHADIFHIFFNMFALYTFGTTLEFIMGSKRFINFYLITGIGAYLVQAGVQAFEVYQILGSVRLPESVTNVSPDDLGVLRAIAGGPMVGASGAIMGILVAFGMLLPNAELMLIFLPVPIKAKYFIPVYLVIELSAGVYKIPGDPIAHFAHLGGAVVGFILMKAWHLRRPGGYL